MTNDKKVTERNTKREILAQYHVALAELKSAREQGVDRRATLHRAASEATVAQATAFSVKDIVKDLATFRLNVNETISGLEESLLEKKAQLDSVQEAIKTQEKTLKDVHDITNEGDSLAAIVQAQSMEKAAHAKSMDETRTSWGKERDLHNEEVSEREGEINKLRKRGEEEYSYGQKIQKQKDQDAFSTERKIREEAIFVREVALDEKEETFKVLKGAVDSHQTKVDEAVAAAVDKTSKREKTSNAFEVRTLKATHESETKIFELKVETLEEKVGTLEESNKVLQDKAATAADQVQTIAGEAIRGAQARVMAPAAETGKTK